MDTLRDAKKAMDEGLIDQKDFEEIKKAWLKAQQIKAGIDAGKSGIFRTPGSNNLEPHLRSVRVSTGRGLLAGEGLVPTIAGLSSRIQQLFGREHPSLG